MIKNISVIILAFIVTCSLATAASGKIAVVDVQKVVSKSTQVQALKKEQVQKQKELSSIIKEASEEIEKQTDTSKKQAIAQKYEKKIKVLRENSAKSYKVKLDIIDKKINSIIAQQAKLMGYDYVLIKGVVLYGGDDITESIIKVVK